MYAYTITVQKCLAGFNSFGNFAYKNKISTNKLLRLMMAENNIESMFKTIFCTLLRILLEHWSFQRIL